MYSILKENINENGLNCVITSTFGDEVILNYSKDELFGKIENPELPILMQKFPGLYYIADAVLKRNMSLIEIKTKEDELLYLLGILLNDSIIGDTYANIDFFKKLEAVLIMLYNIHRFKTIFSKRMLKNRDRAKKLLRDFEPFENILKLLGFEFKSIFEISSLIDSLKNTNPCLSIKAVNSIITLQSYSRKICKG